MDGLQETYLGSAGPCEHCTRSKSSGDSCWIYVSISKGPPPMSRWRSTLPCIAWPRLAWPCHAVPCPAQPCLAEPSPSRPRIPATPARASPVPCLALPSHALPCLALPRLAGPCLAKPCPALPCPATPCYKPIVLRHFTSSHDTTANLPNGPPFSGRKSPTPILRPPSSINWCTSFGERTSSST